MRFHWWDYLILLFGAAFWIILIVITFNLVGLFNFIGGDFAQFWAAATAFVHSGPSSVYDQQTLNSYLHQLTVYYNPNAGCFLQAYNNDPTGFTGFRPIFTWLSSLISGQVCSGGQGFFVPGIVPYPPLLIMLFIPFTFISPVLSFLIWTAINLGLSVYIIWRLAAQFTNKRWFLIVTLLLFAPVAYSIFLGQIIMLLVFFLFLAYQAFQKGHDFQGGFWIGLLLIKPQYAVFYGLGLLIARRWKALGGAIVSGGVILVSTFAILGKGGIGALANTMGIYSGFHSEQPMVHPEQMISWRGLLVNLLPGLSEAQGVVISIILSVATAGLLLIVWRGKWEPGKARFDLQFMATTIITLLAGYHSHWYGAALLLVPGIPLMVREPVSKSAKWFFRISLVLPPLVAIMTSSPIAIAMAFLVLVLCMLGIVMTGGLAIRKSPAKVVEAKPALEKG